MPPSTADALIPADRSTCISSAAARPVPDTSATGRSRSSVASSCGSSSSEIARAPGRREIDGAAEIDQLSTAVLH